MRAQTRRAETRLRWLLRSRRGLPRGMMFLQRLAQILAKAHPATRSFLARSFADLGVDAPNAPILRAAHRGPQSNSTPGAPKPPRRQLRITYDYAVSIRSAAVLMTRKVVNRWKA